MELFEDVINNNSDVLSREDITREYFSKILDKDVNVRVSFLNDRFHYSIYTSIKKSDIKTIKMLYKKCEVRRILFKIKSIYVDCGDLSFTIYNSKK